MAPETPLTAEYWSAMIEEEWLEVPSDSGPVRDSFIRHAIGFTQDCIRDAVAAERERCIAAVESSAGWSPLGSSFAVGWQAAVKDIAARIRAGQ